MVPVEMNNAQANGNTVHEPSTSDTATLASSPEIPDSGFYSPANSSETDVLRIIPPEHSARTLVLCFDGTGDQFDSDNSNIVELFSMLKKDNREQQMVYYQAGIGTYTTPDIATPMMAKISKMLDEAIAWNIDAHVMDGYEFLMQNYKIKDRICIFGFSRGAYTARALAGMIHKVGLLPACNDQQIPFAYKMFTRADEIGWNQSNAFKKAFSVDVKIEFIGVWDTVNSVGLIPRRLPFTTSNTIVRTFRHALALDERRVKFKANLWNRPNNKELALGASGPHHDDKKPKPHKKHVLKAMERQYSEQADKPTDVEEVWFSGCHCDVGGGSVENGTPHTLARIALRWMIRECFKADTGIMFTADGLRSVGFDPANLFPIVRPRAPLLPIGDAYIQRIPTSIPLSKDRPANDIHGSSDILAPKTEEEHELLDAMAPIYDQLDLAWFWWLLEMIPMRQYHQKEDNSWEKGYSRNRGWGRRIPRQRKGVVKIHRSVKLRMEAQYVDGEKYHPKASFDKAVALGNIVWID